MKIFSMTRAMFQVPLTIFKDVELKKYSTFSNIAFLTDLYTCETRKHVLQ